MSDRPTPETDAVISREPYLRGRSCLDERRSLIVRKRCGGERRIKRGEWWVNRRTSIGEDAELWERRPNNGIRRIDFAKVIAMEGAQ
jgi:hypothetical protein